MGTVIKTGKAQNLYTQNNNLARKITYIRLITVKSYISI